jgi:hypothetical protein
LAFYKVTERIYYVMSYVIMHLAFVVKGCKHTSKSTKVFFLSIFYICVGGVHLGPIELKSLEMHAPIKAVPGEG